MNRSLVLVFMAIVVVSSPVVSMAGNDAIDQANSLLAEEKKREAWDILYPLASRQGSAEAAYLIGQLLLDSPEVDDHEKKALQYFEAAAKRGSRIAEEMAQRTRKSLEQVRDRVARQKELSALEAKNKTRWVALQKRLESGFIGPDNEIYPRRLMVFSDGRSTLSSEVERVIAKEAGASVLATYYLEIQRNEIGTSSQLSNDFKPPSQGFTPDIDGQKAKELGVTTIPSILVQDSRQAALRTITFDELGSWISNQR